MIFKSFFTYVFLLFITTSLFSQSNFNEFLKPSDSLNHSRKNAVVISEVSVAALSLIALNQLWYADFERSKFHTIDDTNEWLQMDKFGHVFSSYQLSRLGAESIEWSGASQKNQLLYGATLSFSFLTAIEIMDGFSQEWGFSWSDFAANTLGTGLYLGQELLWHEQRLLLKYSFHQTQFSEQRPDKLGDGFLEEMFKDYNGQTYWLSFNIQSFIKESKLPKWLNLAIGYGAHGMLTGENEVESLLFPDQNRFRQFYLSLDIDLSRIKTNSHVLKTIFSLINVLKIPSPTLEFTSKNTLNLHWFYY